MKLLSIVVPSYNSQEYMKNCIESLLPGGELVEILIVNDGSVDGTAAIADEYEAKYPAIIKAIHQENGGHGEAINAGLREASGLYFKVVDSDDWVEESSYQVILSTLELLTEKNETVDMLISNYVYEKAGAVHKKVIRYVNALPTNKIITWNEVGNFRKGQYILMHSVIYRTKLLIDCGLVLPKHTFYVDNLFVYVPLPLVEHLYYLNVDFYRYFIGRDDQSVNEKVMIRRIDQQIKVNKLMLDMVNLDQVTNKRQRKYLTKYFEIITMVSSILLLKSGTEEHLIKKSELWAYIKNNNVHLYYRLRYRVMGITVNLPGRIGRKISLLVYRILQKLVGFN
ncbi:MAG: glycosyltransferase family A protein [Mobilitalea sp.]